MKPFGKELLVDAYNCDSLIIKDVEAVYDFLEEAVDVLKVKKQAPPFVFRSPIEFPDKAGISAWVPLIESGIQTHTLTVKNFVSIDYYTCGEMNEEKLINLTKKWFSPRTINWQLIKRGVDYYS